MPAKSARQYRFMQMMAHNPEKSKKKGIGPSPEVAKEMIEKTPEKKRKLFSSQNNRGRETTAPIMGSPKYHQGIMVAPRGDYNRSRVLPPEKSRKIGHEEYNRLLKEKK